MSDSLPEILIVDDSATIRASINKFLGDEYVRHVAEDGEEGWEILSGNDNISLVLADMHMPKLNGMLLLQRIRQSKEERIASVPVVMITGRDDTRAAKRAAHTIGASDFLGKPFTREDILQIAESFTKMDRRIAEYQQDIERNKLTGLESNRSLLDFGTKAVGFANSENTNASVIYAEIVETEHLNNTLGNQTTEQIIGKIREVLLESVRKEEMLTRIDEGRFVAVLPMTSAFKAHIVANRLKRAARSIEFDTGDDKLRVNLAVGVTATDSTEDNISLDFKDYCVQAALALRMSIETPKHPVVRYDETYESQFEETPQIEINKVEEDDEGDSALEEFGEFFSGILIGDYAAIPDTYLPTLIEPLEKFLEYARNSTGTTSTSDTSKENDDAA